MQGSRSALPWPELGLFIAGSLLAFSGITFASETRVLQIVTGRNHSCAVVDGGKLKCWGENIYGQLGLGDTDARGDSAAETGAGLPYVDLGTGRTVARLWPARNHTCATLDDGSLKCWGRNANGRLGLGDEEFRGDGQGEMGDKLPALDLGTGRRAVYVALGLQHGCAILDNRQTKCWGFNQSGQLGLGDTTTRGATPGTMGDQLPAIDLGTGHYAIQIAAGVDHTCALLEDQRIKCWGFNTTGQLGAGPVSSLGDRPGTMGDKLPYVDLGMGLKAVGLASGNYHTCALLTDSSIKCWGENQSGQLGLGDTRIRGRDPSEMGAALGALVLEPGLLVMALSIGETHNCALLLGGFSKCWGDGTSGQLGLGDANSRGDRPDEMGVNLPPVELGALRQVTGISAGGSHSCALFNDGTLKCWGANGSGQLGLGDAKSRGTRPGTMGDALAEVKL